MSVIYKRISIKTFPVYIKKTIKSGKVHLVKKINKEDVATTEQTLHDQLKYWYKLEGNVVNQEKSTQKPNLSFSDVKTSAETH